MKKTKKPAATPQPRMGEVIQSRKEGQSRFDGWENLVTLLGTGGDKRMHSQLNWDLRPPEFYEQLYAGGGIPARIVDLIPDESLRRWVDWQNVEKDEAEEIEERCQELDLRGAFLRAWKWGRAYGGGLLHIVTDTSDPASPIQPGEKVIGLRDLSRWDVRILTTDVEYDFGSPNFGHPRIYYLNVQMGAQYKGYPIHWTRMIRFDGQLVPRRTFIRNNYWHDSVLNRIYNSIRNYETSNDTAANALQDFNVDVYKLNNVAAMIGAGKEHIVRNRIEMMAFTKSTINAMILDTKDEEYENKGRSLEGVAELLVHQANRLVAETDIPHTKLLGESPDGSNATGNSTTQQWYNFIDSERENYAKPKLHRLINIIFPDKPDLGFKFKPLRVLDDVETADLRYKIAQTDEIYLNAQVLDPSEVTESRFGSDDYSMETQLDKEARDAGIIGAQDPGGFNEEGEAEGENGGSDEGSGGGSSSSGNMGQEKSGEKAGTPFQTTGDKPPEGNKEKNPKPSDETQEGDKPTKSKKGSDLNGRGREALDSEEVSETSFESGKGESEFEPRNNKLEVPNAQPKTQSFIGQDESLPFRDPKTDVPIKGPGIPNKARSFLPTRGNGVTAQSGFDFEKDSGQKGSSMEITQVEPRRTEDSGEKVAKGTGKSGPVGPNGQNGPEGESGKNGKNGKNGATSNTLATSSESKEDSEDRNRAATIIVKRDGKFLMGKRRDNGKWSLPGGHVEDMESHHQGAMRELMEETGIQAKRLKFEGGRMVEPQQGKSVHVNIYSHNALDTDKPTWKIDPDKEFKEFKWLSMKDALPEDIAGSLQHPNNVALIHMGLLK